MFNDFYQISRLQSEENRLKKFCRAEKFEEKLV
jgi:hypothetical protein